MTPAPAPGWAPPPTAGWHSTLPAFGTSSGFPAPGQGSFAYPPTNASLELPSAGMSRPLWPEEDYPGPPADESRPGPMTSGACPTSLPPFAAAHFSAYGSWGMPPSAASALQQTRWAHGPAITPSGQAYHQPAPTPHPTAPHPASSPWYGPLVYAGNAHLWARLAQGGWPPAAMMHGGFNPGLAYPGDENSPSRMAQGYRWRMPSGMAPTLRPAAATPSPLPRASPSMPHPGVSKQFTTSGQPAGEEEIPDWAKRAMSEAARPLWAVGEHRCTTCKGRPLFEDPWMYFSVDKGRWNHSCVICLLKRRSRSKKPPSFSPLEVTLLQRARRTAAIQVAASSTIALVRSGTRAIHTIDAMLSVERQILKSSPQPSPTFGGEFTNGKAPTAPSRATITTD